MTEFNQDGIRKQPDKTVLKLRELRFDEADVVLQKAILLLARACATLILVVSNIRPGTEIEDDSKGIDFGKKLTDAFEDIKEAAEMLAFSEHNDAKS